MHTRKEHENVGNRNHNRTPSCHRVEVLYRMQDLGKVVGWWDEIGAVAQRRQTSLDPGWLVRNSRHNSRASSYQPWQLDGYPLGI